jgi:hypothetical protein
MPKTRPIVRLKVLAHADPAALARLLSPYAMFLEGASAPLEMLATSRAGDYAAARQLAAAIADPRAPAPLVALAEALDALAHDNVAARLVREDEARKLPRGTLGTVDLALAALLDAPELSRKVLHEARALRAFEDARRAYTDCVPDEGRAVAYAAESHAALVRAHAARFEARDASAYCDVYVTETEQVWIFEITHGDRPRTREIIDTATLALALVTDTAAHRAYAVLDRRTSWLSVAAHAPTVKDLVRAAFGEALAGDEACFRMGEVYDLSPFTRPEEALATRGVPGLARVDLCGITVFEAPDETWNVDFGKGHLLAASERKRARVAEILATGRVVSVRLRVTIEGRAEACKVLLTAKGGRNVLEIDRDDAELCAVVTAYLRAARVLRAARTAPAAAPASSSDAPLRAEV